MRRIFLCLLLLFPLGAVADAVQPVLNQVMYQVSSEQWINTQTAQVTVSVNATLNEDQLASARNDILNKLNQISKSEWHITQFDRSPNDSGLEQLQVLAQTRLSEAALSDLRDQSKKVSKPGETFKIDSIVFDPTLAEIESARKQLRGQIYQQVQKELADLNKTYPNQKYVVHEINFMENISQPKMMMAMMDGRSNAPQPITVSNKMVITANVALVSVNQ